MAVQWRIADVRSDTAHKRYRSGQRSFFICDKKCDAFWFRRSQSYFTYRQFGVLLWPDKGSYKKFTGKIKELKELVENICGVNLIFRYGIGAIFLKKNKRKSEM